MKVKCTLIRVCLLWAVLLSALPAVVQAQFTFTTNNGALTITEYTGSGGAVVIPSTTNGYLITSIGGTRSNGGAFVNYTSLSNITIPYSVTNIMTEPFRGCTNLTTIMVDTLNPTYSSVDGALFNKSQTMLLECPEGKVGSYAVLNSVTYIGTFAFDNCTRLTNITIPDSVASTGEFAFESCTHLISVLIGNGITGIGYDAFYNCTGLTSVFFKGDTPAVGDLVAFDGDYDETVYYLPGTMGWGLTFCGAPTALWFLPNPLILNNETSFGVQTNEFGFTISWATNISVVVEACTNLFNPVWQPVQTNTLTGGSSYFSDPQWTNYPSRFYRLISP
jgi:hypothetical protein